MESELEVGVVIDDLGSVMVATGISSPSIEGLSFLIAFPSASDKALLVELPCTIKNKQLTHDYRVGMVRESGEKE